MLGQLCVCPVSMSATCTADVWPACTTLPAAQGMLKGQDLSEAYASADIFIMPSETETLGFVVLEAMASGLAVVSVAAGGLTDIITQPGKTGHLYPQNDYVKAAQLVRELVENPAARAAMAAAGRAEVEKFGWSAATKVLREQQYSRAIRVSDGKQRFRFMAIRVGIGRIWRMLMSAVVGVFAALFNKLDEMFNGRKVGGSGSNVSPVV